MTATILTILSLLFATAAFLLLFREMRKSSAAIDEVQRLVEQQKADLRDYQHLLMQTLRHHNIDIPMNPHPE